MFEGEYLRAFQGLSRTNPYSSLAFRETIWKPFDSLYPTGLFGPPRASVCQLDGRGQELFTLSRSQYTVIGKGMCVITY